MQDKPIAWFLDTENGRKIIEFDPKCDSGLWKPLSLQDFYNIAWNDAVEHTSKSIEHSFEGAFPRDTLTSLGIYIRKYLKTVNF